MDNAKNDDNDVTSIGLTSGSTNRLIFTDEDGETLRNLFPHMVEGNSNIRRTEVIDTIKEKKPELLLNYTETQIVLRVRTEKRAFNRRKKRKTLTFGSL